MPPEMLKAMMSDEELVTMLRSPKMQEIVSIRVISHMNNCIVVLYLIFAS